MLNWFKKNKETNPVIEFCWTYGYGIDNIPDNPDLLKFTSIGNYVVNTNTKIPRIGDKVIIADETHPNWIYEAEVKEITYNYVDSWISIYCDCKNLTIKNN